MTRKMKDSGIEWIGEIPEDWEVVKNKHVFNRLKEIVGNRWEKTQLLSLTTKGIVKKDINNLEGKLPESFSTYQVVRNGDLILCLFDLDMSAVFNGLSLYNGMISPAYKRYGLKIAGDVRYYNYLFDFIFNDRKYKNYSTTLRFTLDNQEFDNIPTIKLNYKEQIKISNFLDKKTDQIEDIKSTIIQEIQTLEDYKKSIITEAVTKGLDKNVEMKDSGIKWIGDIPRHWEVKRLKQLLSNDPDSLKVGPFGSALKSSDLVNNGKWVYNQRTVLDGNFINNDTFIDDKKFVELRGFKVKAGDILLTTRGTIGKIAIVPSGFYEGVIHPCIIKFNLNKELFENELIRFIFNHTDLVLKQVEFLSNSTTIGVIYSYNLVNIYIPIPPISEQNQIIDYLNKKTKSIDETISLKQKQLETLEEYKKSLIYEYVTGKKEVNDGEET